MLIKSQIPLCSATKCVDLLFDNDFKLPYMVIYTYTQVSRGDAVKGHIHTQVSRGDAGKGHIHVHTSIKRGCGQRSYTPQVSRGDAIEVYRETQFINPY